MNAKDFDFSKDYGTTTPPASATWAHDSRLSQAARPATYDELIQELNIPIERTRAALAASEKGEK